MAADRDLIDTGKEAGSKHGTRQLGEVLADAGLPASDLARQGADQARRTIEHRAQDVMDWIRAHPIKSVLIGTAVGFVLGRMSGR